MRQHQKTAIDPQILRMNPLYLISLLNPAAGSQPPGRQRVKASRGQGSVESNKGAKKMKHTVAVRVNLLAIMLGLAAGTARGVDNTATNSGNWETACTRSWRVLH
jgi:hypothetical protein